eukprot:CAMPEP_0202035458 /NCGR_PEP_ID=MMETSP0962-20130828/874_1 /ASSEMBLY_ACC=CAM_ASM_000488 /TAXON_ID=4773 /ORGANISM="Schizochytrium aggregatum, Strain ATCC28209" /LENGTH=70 /DNA_ID=CAMNT_0048599465 /DNA_START=103 /DNA_END=315 /DNA_ORIENTATION=+
MSYGGRDLKSLQDEVHQLEHELKLVRGGSTTRERCAEITNFVKEHEAYDPLVTRTVTPFTQVQKRNVCCS